jgi:hypothetical protein
MLRRHSLDVLEHAFAWASERNCVSSAVRALFLDLQGA